MGIQLNGTSGTDVISAVDGSLTVEGLTISGDFNIADKIVHSGDTNTAIRFPSADTFSVETAGQQNVQVTGTRTLLKSPSGTDTKVRFQHQGNSGYGDITLDRTVNAFIIDNDPGNAGNNATYFSVKNKGTENLRITHDGKVGIGTDDPDYGLHVYGAGDILVEDSGNGSAHMRMRSSNNGSDVSNWKIKTSSNNYFYIENDTVGGTSQFTINDSGDMGLAMNEPRSRLDVFEKTSGNQTAIRIGNSNTPSSVNDKRLEFVDGVGTTEGTNKFTYGYIQGFRSAASNAGDLIFGTKNNNAAAPTEKLRITSDGKIGINKANPSYPLHVNGEGIAVDRNAGDPYVNLRTSDDTKVSIYGGASTGFRVFTKPSGGSLTERLRIDPSGQVLCCSDESFGSTGVASGNASMMVRGDNGAWALKLLCRHNQNDYAYLGFASQDNSENLAEIYVTRTAANTAKMVFGTRNSGTNVQALTISNTGEVWCNQGNLKLGTSSGTDSIIHTTNAAGILYRADENGHKFQTYSGGWQNRLIIKDDGNVGIGEDNPGSSLVVEGTIIANNGTLQVDKHIVDGTDDWAGASYILHNKRSFTNGSWTNYFKFDRSDTAADNNDCGVFAGHLHIVYMNDRSNSVHTTGYDVFPFIVRGRSNNTVSGNFGSAVVDLHEVIGSSVEVRFDSATASVIYIQIKIYNSDAGGSERLCHAWIDGGGVANLSNRFLYPEITT